MQSSTAAPDTVVTPRLIGRRVTAAHLDYMLEVDGDSRIAQWLFGPQGPEQSRARLVRWMAMWQETGLGFWIFEDSDRRLVGHGGLFNSPREEGEVEVGYVIKPAHWGRGLATEITLASLKIGFESLRLKRIIGIAQSANAPSRRVMEKCGMLFEAAFASPDGRPGVRYAIAKSRWPS
ncbi:MAG: GNAT family N-acetyltransferase [Candidatus Cybelea sp.]|jgi:RimJ/RimL family protein N-acetyltransferase